MSKWGVTYKGTEILFPEDWNNVADALNELDERTPIRVSAGVGVWSGDGTTTTFVIAHNWGEVPTVAFTEANTPDASGVRHVELTENELRVVYENPPPAGTNNVVLFWIIMKF